MEFILANHEPLPRVRLLPVQVRYSLAFSLIEVPVFRSATQGVISCDTALPVDITYCKCQVEVPSA